MINRTSNITETDFNTSRVCLTNETLWGREKKKNENENENEN